MHQDSLGFINFCQNCGAEPLSLILGLGHQPIVQEYLTTNQLHEPETTYPLNLCRCQKCGLVQLDYIVEPEKVFFPDYPYRTGLTNMLVRNFLELAETLDKKYHLTPADLVVDIGSNDGTLLKGFKAKGTRVLGIEPTNAAKDANKSGIPTMQAFFNKDSVRKALKKYGPARIITATNVFAHINNTPELVKNIKLMLDDNGVFVSESQYLLDIVNKLEFDTIYHEHLRFYSLKPLAHLFKLHGLSLTDAERISAAGGSIRVYAQKGKHPMSTRAARLIAAEEKNGLYDVKILQQWTERIEKAKNNLVALILKLKKQGSTIVGLGSPARSNTLLGFTKINEHLLDYTCEKTGSPKIGMFTPGTHIPVVGEKKLYEEQPDYCLILSWHIGEELMKIVRKNGYKGKFIMPLPKSKVIIEQ